MKSIQNIGLLLFTAALLIFIGMLGLGGNKLTQDLLPGKTEAHKTAISDAASQTGILDQEMGSIDFISKLKSTIAIAQSNQLTATIPEGVGEWDVKIGYWEVDGYVQSTVKSTANGPVHDNPWLFFLMTFGLAILGGLMFILPKFKENPGIKHNGIYHDPLTRGLKFNVRTGILLLTIVAVLIYGFLRLGNVFWPIVTLLIAGAITYFVFII